MVATPTKFEFPPDALVPATPTSLPPTHTFDVRQNVVTTFVTTGDSSSSGTASSSSSSGGFPVAVAVPALVGGMAAACLAFGLWWWMSKRREKQRRVSIPNEPCTDDQERWETAQRRKRRRANSNNNSRPSISSSRDPSSTNLKNMAEKDAIPPVPMLPKHTEYAEKPYGQENAYGQSLAYNAYPQQPNIDQYEEPQRSPTHSNGSSSRSASGSSDTTSSSAPLVEKPPTKPSRSAARIAVAENAVARENMDANVRYAPKKPSPLALAAQEKAAREAPGWGDGPFRQPPQATLAPPVDTSGAGQRALSGEWGVALGSPNHDNTTSFAEQQGQYGSSYNNRYSNDPYIASAAVESRAPTDPYAGYNDPVSTSQKRSNWV